MSKGWYVDKTIAEEIELCAAIVHDELLQRQYNIRGWVTTSPKELAATLPLTVAEVTRALRKLEDAGLIAKQDIPHRAAEAAYYAYEILEDIEK